ncbi:MAG: cysteine desulfurase [Xanthomonadales bacterium]|nr:cysteine desulfurase [Xanthomonadales bacterium]
MSDATATERKPSFEVDRWRADFPILDREVHGKPLIYLDNAATAQRPEAVIRATDEFYRRHNANIHRGVHTLSEEATEAFEQARDTMRAFIGAVSRREVIFTRGATEGVNLVAQAYARPRLKPGDEIVITHLEHHSNIVPWQLVCEQTGARLKVAPINRRGEVIIEAYEKLLGPQVKMVGMIHVSNALGTINPVREMIAAAHAQDIPVLVDGAQATPHMKVDVADLDCDFYCVAGHKMFGPTGIGVLYGRESLLDAMPPWHGGGEMIKHVTFEETIYNDLPGKFEAGTPNIAGAIGLGAAARYMEAVGIREIADHEAALLAYATERLEAMDGVEIIGTAAHKASVISLQVAGAHPHDIGTILDHAGIAIRTGHHCAMPVMQFFEIPGTARLSMAFYNTFEEIDRFVAALEKARQLLTA